MNRELIINSTPTEVTIALVEDKQLVELDKESCKSGFAVGDIYLGKVRKIMPGLNAAFVNIGHEKDAFIHYLDLGPQFTTLHKLVANLSTKKKNVRIESLKLDQPMEKTGKLANFIAGGQPIMVQIAKEAISTKGPRLTSDISLAGRNVVLIPFTNKISISQKIRSNEEKKRLKRICDKVLPKNYGVIISTAAQGKSDIDIEQDILALIRRWESALEGIKTKVAPVQLLSEMSRANTIIRDSLNSTFNAIHVNDEGIYNEGNYLEKNADLVRRMVSQGHIVGNHTMHHPDMSKIAQKEAFQKELQDLENLFLETTGKELPKFYRPPQGIYSEANLKMAKELGYKTVFWSLAYVDWNNDSQPTREQAFSKLLPRTHDGAVVLLHSTSKTNAEILDELLTKWKDMGYTFENIDQLF